MNESLRALLNEQYKIVAELRKENEDLKERKENLIWADKKKSDHIDKLEEENKKLKEIMRDVLYRYTKHNIKNVIYKKENIEIGNGGFDYNLDDYILS